MYEAMHVQSGTPVAIKEVSAKASSVESEDQIEVWAQVRHENIIRLLDFHRTEDNLYFVMEMANGRDLFYGVVQHYAGNEPRGYSEADTVKIMSQILSAIRFLHLRKIVHCDLKPDNVLVTVEEGQVTIKIADWGYAQIISDDQGFLTSRLGTVNYMAPEIMARQVPTASFTHCKNVTLVSPTTKAPTSGPAASSCSCSCAGSPPTRALWAPTAGPTTPRRWLRYSSAVTATAASTTSLTRTGPLSARARRCVCVRVCVRVCARARACLCTCAFIRSRMFARTRTLVNINPYRTSYAPWSYSTQPSASLPMPA